MKIKFERELGNNYLVVYEDKLDFNSYQIQMLISNKIKGVLSTSVRTINMIQKVYVDITSKQSLQQLSKIKELSSNEILKLINDIITIVEGVKDYMITEDNCLLSPNYIYIDANTMLPSLIIIPGIGEDNGLSILIKFLLDILEGKGNEDKLAYCLYRFIKSNHKSMIGLKKIIETSYKESTFENIELPKKLEIRINEEENLQKNFTRTNENSSEINKISWSEEEVIGITNSRGSDLFFRIRDNKTLCIGGIILICSIVILVVNVVCFKDYQGIINTKNSAIVNAIILVIMSVGVYFILNIFDNKSDAIKEEDYDDYVPVFEFIDNTIEDNKVVSEPCFTQFIKVNTTVNKQMQLTEVKTGRKYKIEEDAFIIGKLEGTVNIKLDSPTVSRLHAQLSKKDGEVFIQDLNSKNGTYVEGVRLEPGEQRKLDHNETITIAEINFNYHILNYNNI